MPFFLVYSRFFTLFVQTNPSVPMCLLRNDDFGQEGDKGCPKPPLTNEDFGLEGGLDCCPKSLLTNDDFSQEGGPV